MYRELKKMHSNTPTFPTLGIVLPSLGDLFADGPVETGKYYEVVRTNMLSLVFNEEKTSLILYICLVWIEV